MIEIVLDVEYDRRSGKDATPVPDGIAKALVAALGDIRTMKTSSKTTNALSLAMLLSIGLAGPAQAQATSDSQTFINLHDLKWGAAPPSLPKGARIAVLQGDPGKSGPFVLRLEVPPKYKVPPHWHSQDESLTVLAGALYLGMGDKFEMGKAYVLNPGGFHFLPGKAHHYAYAKRRTVIQVNGNGPFDVTYIDPNDDPQKATK